MALLHEYSRVIVSSSPLLLFFSFLSLLSTPPLSFTGPLPLMNDNWPRERRFNNDNSRSRKSKLDPILLAYYSLYMERRNRFSYDEISMNRFDRELWTESIDPSTTLYFILWGKGTMTSFRRKINCTVIKRRFRRCAHRFTITTPRP